MRRIPGLVVAVLMCSAPARADLVTFQFTGSIDFRHDGLVHDGVHDRFFVELGWDTDMFDQDPFELFGEYGPAVTSIRGDFGGAKITSGGGGQMFVGTESLDVNTSNFFSSRLGGDTVAGLTPWFFAFNLNFASNPLTSDRPPALIGPFDSGTWTLRFVNDAGDPAGGFGGTIDSVRRVPEPSVLLLLSVGAAALTATRRRLRKH